MSALRKNYDEIVAVDSCDLHVGAGELVGFLGPNGAGKTTTMRAILGLVHIDGGSITWNDHPVTADDRRHIGYMPQERGLYVRMKVHEHIAYIGRLAGVAAREADRRADKWIERVGLEERRDDLIQELSTGNQQRVQLAVALVHEPELLVLDEPFAGLDPLAVATMSEVMLDQVENGAAVVFSSHQLSLVQDACERVSIIAHGKTVAAGRVADLRLGSERRELRVTWTHDRPDWTPTFDVIDSLASAKNVTALTVPAAVDPAAVLAEAGGLGTVAGFTLEPPGLDTVFVELVGETA